MTKNIVLMFIFFIIAQHIYAQLTGEWADENGACYKIRQVGNTVYWHYDDRPRVINVFMGYVAGNTLTGTWADLPGGNLQGSGTISFRIESNDRMVKTGQSEDYSGSVLIRGVCGTKPSVTGHQPDLSGIWYDYSERTGNSGGVSKVLQNGEKLTFINEYNAQSDGSFIDNSTVIANGWEGGLKARLEDNARRIVWTNGSVWQRDKRATPNSRPDLSGIWYDYSERTGNSGGVSKVLQNGDKLTFINEFNAQSEGYFIDNSTVLATGWEGGLKARLEDNARRMVWVNGSVWQRNKK